MKPYHIVFVLIHTLFFFDTILEILSYWFIPQEWPTFHYRTGFVLTEWTYGGNLLLWVVWGIFLFKPYKIIFLKLAEYFNKDIWENE